MKSFLRILAVLAIPVWNFTAVGTNNMTINIGGVFNYSQGVINDDSTISERSKRMSDYVGGGFNLEIGHLYLSQGDVIHAMDTRLSFGINFDDPHKGQTLQSPLDIEFNTLSFSIGTSYAMGKVVGKGRILVDILGLNFGYFTANLILSDKVESATFISRMGNNLLVSLNLPLGVQYIFNNGLMLGFKHRLDFAFSTIPTGESIAIEDNSMTTTPLGGGIFGIDQSQTSYLAYNLTFSIGYVFGK
ncbi:MAG: hypothetical protein ACRCWI_05070 [Brevinema sp.]